MGGRVDGDGEANGVIYELFVWVGWIRCWIGEHVGRKGMMALGLFIGNPTETK